MKLSAKYEASFAFDERVGAHGGNTQLPTGAEHLLVAELVARGQAGFVAPTAFIPRITQQLRLPAFDGRFDLLWPRTR
jgi:hypothetical protein